MKNIKNQGSLQQRQGDVLFLNTKSSKLRPETIKRLQGYKKDKVWDNKKAKGVPVAYGEVSGHEHKCADVKGVELRFSKDIQETIKHLTVKNDVATFTHQEHDAVSIPKGENIVRIQSEYRMGTLRRTMD